MGSFLILLGPVDTKVLTEGTGCPRDKRQKMADF